MSGVVSVLASRLTSELLPELVSELMPEVVSDLTRGGGAPGSTMRPRLCRAYVSSLFFKVSPTRKWNFMFFNA